MSVLGMRPSVMGRILMMIVLAGRRMMMVGLWLSSLRVLLRLLLWISRLCLLVAQDCFMLKDCIFHRIFSIYIRILLLGMESRALTELLWEWSRNGQPALILVAGRPRAVRASELILMCGLPRRRTWRSGRLKRLRIMRSRRNTLLVT